MAGLGPILAAIRDLVSIDVKVERIEKDLDEISRDAKEMKRLLADYLRLVERVSARQERLEEIVQKLEEDLSQRVTANIQAKMIAVQAEVDLVRERFRRGMPEGDLAVGDGIRPKVALE